MESKEIVVQDTKVELFIKGEYLKKDENAVAIVGTRNPTIKGKALAHFYACELVKENVTIISGLARGIDSQAHKGALYGGGRTIAVLGHGLNVPIYPPENKGLAETIVDHGCLVSPFKNNFKPNRRSFVERNKIVVALSKCILIVEGDLDSGTQSTATIAADQNKEVFAIPGSPLTSYLIESGVNTVNDPQDILNYLASIS